MKAFSESILEVIKGEGHEMTLLFMQHIAYTQGLKVPKIFSEKAAWSKGTGKYLRISGLAGASWFNDAPVDPDGWKLTYAYKEDSFNLGLCTWNKPGHLTCQEFANEFLKVFAEIKRLVDVADHVKRTGKHPPKLWLDR